MAKLRIIFGGKILKRSAMGYIRKEDREEWVDPFCKHGGFLPSEVSKKIREREGTEVVTYYVTWVIIDGRRVDIQRLDGCRFWVRYDPGLEELEV